MFWWWRLEERERWCEGEEGYKRVGRKGGARSLMMETTAHFLLLCCIGLIHTNMIPDGCLTSSYYWTKGISNKL